MMFQVNAAKNYFLMLKLIHFALLVGLAMFAGICFFVSSSELTVSVTEHALMLTMAVALASILLPVSFVIHRPLLKFRKETDSISKYQQLYKSICVVRWALAEGPALFALVMFFVTGNLLLVVVAIICIVGMIANRATVQQFELYFSHK
jgi:uncharacterized membrane protein